MQHIPDKEFDKLFKDKFKDAEIEPSANLWANIEQQLEPKRKRVFPIYWMAAASVVVAITAMLVFNKKEVIKLHPNEATANIVKPNVVNDVEASIVVLPVKAAVNNAVRVANSKVNAVVLKASENKAPENNLKNNQEPVQPMIANNRLPIKQQEVKPLDVITIKETQVDNPIVTAMANVQSSGVETAANEEIATERKGIRNVGDLVNFVVDKVDKRDKKLVRFNTDDDDNSSIIGINIGFLKFNKKNR